MSRFFEIALERINRETKALESFCAELDKDPAAKKAQIAAYKCAKYRYVGATAVWCMFFHSHRVHARNEGNHYLIPEVNEIFVQNKEYLALYDNAPAEEKLDYGLYFGVRAFGEAEIAKLESKLPSASDWEKVELTNRMEGLRAGIACLDGAWRERGDGNEGKA